MLTACCVKRSVNREQGCPALDVERGEEEERRGERRREEKRREEERKAALQRIRMRCSPE